MEPPLGHLPHTQMGFVRLSMQPAVAKTTISFGEAIDALEKIVAAPEHEFWGSRLAVGRR